MLLVVNCPKECQWKERKKENKHEKKKGKQKTWKKLDRKLTLMNFWSLNMSHRWKFGNKEIRLFTEKCTLLKKKGTCNQKNSLRYSPGNFTMMCVIEIFAWLYYSQHCCRLHKSFLMSWFSAVTERGALDAIAPPSRKNLPFLKKYENQSKLYVDTNTTPALFYFPKACFRFSFSDFLQ